MSEHTKFWTKVELQRETLTLEFRGVKYRSELVAPAASAGKRPLVMVIHNYQGLKFFDVDVAEYMARLGYVGLAIDLYGERVPDENRLFPSSVPEIEQHLKLCFEAMAAMDHDHELFRALQAEWLQVGYTHDRVDESVPAAAIGYCFGGMAVLECVRGGLNLGGVVSFHGLLQTGEDPSPEKNGVIRPPLKLTENQYNTNTIVQIENGALDHLVPEESKQRFFDEMDEAGVQWLFNQYAGTPHGFALPATIGAPGHLHEFADRRSTMAMLNLFRDIFPDVAQNPVPFNASGTSIPV